MIVTINSSVLQVTKMECLTNNQVIFETGIIDKLIRKEVNDLFVLNRNICGIYSLIESYQLTSKVVNSYRKELFQDFTWDFCVKNSFPYQRSHKRSNVYTEEQKKTVVLEGHYSCQITFGSDFSKIFSNLTISLPERLLTLEKFVEVMRKILNEERIFQRAHTSNSHKPIRFRKSVCQIVSGCKDKRSIIQIHVDDDIKDIRFIFGFEM